jgi:hypothetical protein
MLTGAAEQRRVPKDEGQLKSSLVEPKAPKGGRSASSLSETDHVTDSRTGKRRRSIKDGDLSNHDSKRPKHTHGTSQSRSGLRRGKEDLIQNWLSESCWSRRTSADNGSSPQEASDNMPRKTAEVLRLLPSPDDSFSSVISSSRKSEKSAASVRDTDYRSSLGYRNICINRQDPPVELMRRATRIISRPRASPEMDDPTVQELRGTVRRLENKGEEDIVQQLAPHIIPAMNRVPDPRLERNADQPWFNYVPVPLDPSILINPLPLPKPKPDLVFGYSEAAFTRNQLGTIDLLIDKSGQSYAVPDKELRFPFLDVDFKSQAKNGTHYIATNQAAGAGAAALNGNLELTRRSFGVEKLDFNEPQFFSLTMDHAYAQINVHWLSRGVQDGPFSFHVEGLSRHFLDDPIGIRAVTRAIKNILDYGADARLRKLCEALDAYREKIILERKATTSQRDQRYEAKSQPEQRRRSRRDPQPSYDQQGYQSPGAQQSPYEQQVYQSPGAPQSPYEQQVYESPGAQQSYEQQVYQSPGAQQSPYEQQVSQSPGAQQPLYGEQEYESRPDLRVEENASIYVEEDWVDGSLGGSPEDLQAKRQPQRKQTTTRRQARSRTNVQAQAVRTSSRRAARIVEYEEEVQGR